MQSNSLFTTPVDNIHIYSDEGRRGARDSKGKSGAGKEGFGFVLQPQQTGHLAVNSSGYQSILELNVRSFDI